MFFTDHQSEPSHPVCRDVQPSSDLDLANPLTRHVSDMHVSLSLSISLSLPPSLSKYPLYQSSLKVTEARHNNGNIFSNVVCKRREIGTCFVQSDIMCIKSVVWFRLAFPKLNNLAKTFENTKVAFRSC